MGRDDDRRLAIVFARWVVESGMLAPPEKYFNFRRKYRISGRTYPGNVEFSFSVIAMRKTKA
jgi:hypothetical protein